MASKHTKNSEIEELIRRSNASRIRLSADVEVLKQRLDVPSKIRQSLRQSPTKWVLGSLASGMAASFIFRGKKKKKSKAPKSRSFSYKIIALILTTARPLIKVWLTRRLKEWIKSTYLQSQYSPSTTERSHQYVPTHGSRPR